MPLKRKKVAVLKTKKDYLDEVLILNVHSSDPVRSFACSFVRPSVLFSAGPSIRPFFRPLVRWSVLPCKCPSAHLSIRPSIHPQILPSFRSFLLILPRLLTPLRNFLLLSLLFLIREKVLLKFSCRLRLLYKTNKIL